MKAYRVFTDLNLLDDDPQRCSKIDDFTSYIKKYGIQEVKAELSGISEFVDSRYKVTWRWALARVEADLSGEKVTCWFCVASSCKIPLDQERKELIEMITDMFKKEDGLTLHWGK